MGLLDFLFGCKNEAPINHSPKQTISAPTGAAKVRIIERRGKRTWLYNDEALKLDDYHGLTTWRSIRASASAYFQDDIAAIDAATAELNNAWQAASAQMYQGGAQAGPGAGAQGSANAGSSSSNDNIQDADFEEVK